MNESWESAAHSALVRIFENVRRKPRADIQQLRADLDGFIDEQFHVAAGFEKAKVAWAVIGANALELAIARKRTFRVRRCSRHCCKEAARLRSRKHPPLRAARTDGSHARQGGTPRKPVTTT